MSYEDLRDWIDQASSKNNLLKLEGVNWDIEASVVSELTSKAVLFDNFPGYQEGYRLLANMVKSTPNWLLSMNLKTEARGIALTRELKNLLRKYVPVPPVFVSNGPVMENIHDDDEINVLEFPVPKVNEKDGGRYIGTADAVIVGDPDTGRVNFGTFRMQVHNKNTLGLYTCQGKDTSIIIENYHRLGKSCPVVAIVGLEPALFLTASQHIVHLDVDGESGEYGFAGWLKGKPIEVIKGSKTGLPIPARAEVAIEGEIIPGDVMIEGPFGEWTGYSDPTMAFVIRIKRIMHRDSPILTMVVAGGATSPPAVDKSLTPSGEGYGGHTVFRASLIWDQLEKAGLRGIQGVATHMNRSMVVVSIKNLYAGHSKQVGHIAAQCHAGAFMDRYVVVVDDNIDPTNLYAVVWAMARYADPQRAIDIESHCWSDRMDSAIPLSEKAGNEPVVKVYNSRCIIDACRPVEWAPDYKELVTYNDEVREKVLSKWGNLLDKR